MPTYDPIADYQNLTGAAIGGYMKGQAEADDERKRLEQELLKRNLQEFARQREKDDQRKYREAERAEDNERRKAERAEDQARRKAEREEDAARTDDWRKKQLDGRRTGRGGAKPKPVLGVLNRFENEIKKRTAASLSEGMMTNNLEAKPEYLPAFAKDHPEDYRAARLDAINAASAEIMKQIDAATDAEVDQLLPVAEYLKRERDALAGQVNAPK